MGWNGSGGTATPQKPIKKKTQAPSASRGLVAGLIVVAVACVGLFYFLSGEKEQTAKTDTPKKSGTIAEVKPAPAAPAKAEAEKPKEEKKELPPQKVGETRNGYILLPSGRLHKVRGVITNSVSATQFKGKYEIFDFHCENEIACMLTMEPGETLVGTPVYNGRFTKQFLESLKTPILINADDSEEDKELKRNVIQAKKELKEAYDRGEDIEKIMLDTRKEFQDLARYKMELRGMIYEYKKTEGVTDQDVEDYVQAANKMLEDKGIAPLDLGPISRRKLRMKLLEERKNQQ